MMEEYKSDEQLKEKASIAYAHSDREYGEYLKGQLKGRQDKEKEIIELGNKHCKCADAHCDICQFLEEIKRGE